MCSAAALQGKCVQLPPRRGRVRQPSSGCRSVQSRASCWRAEHWHVRAQNRFCERCSGCSKLIRAVCVCGQQRHHIKHAFAAAGADAAQQRPPKSSFVMRRRSTQPVCTCASLRDAREERPRRASIGRSNSPVIQQRSNKMARPGSPPRRSSCRWQNSARAVARTGEADGIQCIHDAKLGKERQNSGRYPALQQLPAPRTVGLPHLAP